MIDRHFWRLEGLSRRQFAEVILLVVLDQLIIFFAYMVVYSVRVQKFFVEYVDRLAPTIVVAALTLFLMYAFGVYRRIWAQSSGHEISVLIKPVVGATAFVLLFDLIVEPRPLPLSVIVVGNFLALCGFIAIRYRSRLISGTFWRWKAIWSHDFPKLRQRVLIVGAGKAGQALAWQLKHIPQDNPYQIVGFIDDYPSKQKMFVEGSQVLGSRKDIEHLADLLKVDLIVVAIHNVSGSDFRDILSHCERTKAVIKVIPDLFAMVNARNDTPPLREVRVEDLIGRKTVARDANLSLEPIMHKIVCITGAAGSIGSELTRQIVDCEPRKVVMLDNNESGLHDLMTEISTRCPTVELALELADITVPGSIQRVFNTHRPQIVFHAAAYKHVPMLERHPNEALRVNIQATWSLAELARRSKVERFVLISSDKAVKPTSVMGASKRVCELILHALSQEREYGTLFASVRFGNVLGSRGSVVPTFNQQIHIGGPVTVTHPDMTRYFMSTAEAVNLILNAASMTTGDDIYMLKMGEVVNIRELAERMIRLHGLRPYQDVQIVFTGMRPGEKMHEELFSVDEVSLPTAHPHIVKIGTKASGIPLSLFLDELTDLLEAPPQNTSAIMNKLTHIINLAQV